MMAVVNQFGTTSIHYGVVDHPELFEPRQHPQQPAFPTEEVRQWLTDHLVTWNIQRFYHIDLIFPDKATAALFRLTFA
jgi:hypothetical protein